MILIKNAGKNAGKRLSKLFKSLGVGDQILIIILITINPIMEKVTLILELIPL